MASANSLTTSFPTPVGGGCCSWDPPICDKTSAYCEDEANCVNDCGGQWVIYPSAAPSIYQNDPVSHHVGSMDAGNWQGFIILGACAAGFCCLLIAVCYCLRRCCKHKSSDFWENEESGEEDVPQRHMSDNNSVQSSLSDQPVIGGLSGSPFREPSAPRAGAARGKAGASGSTLQRFGHVIREIDGTPRPLLRHVSKSKNELKEQLLSVEDREESDSETDEAEYRRPVRDLLGFLYSSATTIIAGGIEVATAQDMGSPEAEELDAISEADRLQRRAERKKRLQAGGVRFVEAPESVTTTRYDVEIQEEQAFFFEPRKSIYCHYRTLEVVESVCEQCDQEGPFGAVDR